MSVEARLSLRAQLALWAALLSAVSAALSASVLAPLVVRGVGGQARAEGLLLVDTAATAIAERCTGAVEPAPCVAGAAAKLSETRAVRFVARLDAPPPGDGPSARASLDGRTLFLRLERRVDGPNSRAELLVRLGLGLIALSSLALFLLLYAVLVRVVARPAERLLAATERLGREETPLLSDQGPVLGRLGTAFDRMRERLDREHDRAEAKIIELERVNRALAEARDAMVRSEKLATVGRLSAGVAHEIGNPLAAILGYLELLKLKAAEPPVGEYVERMEREVRRIDRIVQDLLDFARPGRGGEIEPLSLRESVERTVRLVSTQRRFRDVQVRLDGVPADLPAVLADDHYLQQVLLNLLVNAADAMGGAGVVHLEAQLVEAAPDARRRAQDGPVGKRVRLDVRDEGPGIPADALPKLFDPFFTTKEPGQGTGLGLAICHSLVEAFGGRIQAANAPARGACFSIELRLAPEGVAPGARV